VLRSPFLSLLVGVKTCVPSVENDPTLMPARIHNVLNAAPRRCENKRWQQRIRPGPPSRKPRANHDPGINSVRNATPKSTSERRCALAVTAFLADDTELQLHVAMGFHPVITRRRIVVE
jgi:hypothetical protein